MDAHASYRPTCSRPSLLCCGPPYCPVPPHYPTISCTPQAPQKKRPQVRAPCFTPHHECKKAMALWPYAPTARPQLPQQLP